jgi:hypothetical protein
MLWKGGVVDNDAEGDPFAVAAATEIRDLAIRQYRAFTNTASRRKSEDKPSLKETALAAMWQRVITDMQAQIVAHGGKAGG